MSECDVLGCFRDRAVATLANYTNRERQEPQIYACCLDSELEQVVKPPSQQPPSRGGGNRELATRIAMPVGMATLDREDVAVLSGVEEVPIEVYGEMPKLLCAVMPTFLRQGSIPGCVAITVKTLRRRVRRFCPGMTTSAGRRFESGIYGRSPVSRRWWRQQSHHIRRSHCHL